MKEEMSSVDVYAVVRELQFLLDSKLEKAYQHTADEIRLKLQEFKTGKYDLIIEAGKRLHLTTHPRESPKLPPAFPMILRKYMSGGRVTRIQQHGFDRIVEIDFIRAGVKNTHRSGDVQPGQRHFTGCGQAHHDAAALPEDEGQGRAQGRAVRVPARPAEPAGHGRGDARETVRGVRQGCRQDAGHEDQHRRHVCRRGALHRRHRQEQDGQVRSWRARSSWC